MDIKRDDDESSYAVWEAASKGHLEVVKYLVGEKRAYIGISTAFYAGTNGHLEVLKYLVDEKGAKIDDIKEAVKHCTKHGHLEVVKYLVEKLTTPAPEAYRHARDILNAPYPEGEKAITTSAYYSYRYAIDVLKAPFPLGEAAIATSVECSFAYARDVLKAPFPLGEAAIATNVECSYLYAKDILKAPFPLGETAIATAGSYSYGYAKNVLKAPFPLGEKAIATNGYYIEIYKELFPETQVAPAQTQAQATSMSDKQKEAIKDSFEILLYSLGEWIEFDEQDSSYPACFCSESIMDNIDHLLEAFPDICKDLAVKKYSEVKSYMDEYSKDRDEKENRV